MYRHMTCIAYIHIHEIPFSSCPAVQSPQLKDPLDPRCFIEALIGSLDANQVAAQLQTPPRVPVGSCSSRSQGLQRLLDVVSKVGENIAEV